MHTLYPHAFRYVEVGAECTGWSDPKCVTDFHVDPAEWTEKPALQREREGYAPKGSPFSA